MTLDQNKQTGFDIVVIGGGINGTGIVRDAAGRGYKVCLLEQGDLAQATSSASTKLIHGGLRYLEHYAFRLVRESLQGFPDQPEGIMFQITQAPMDQLGAG